MEFKKIWYLVIYKIWFISLSTNQKVCKGDKGWAWNKTALLVNISHCQLCNIITSDSTDCISTTYPPTKERSGSYIYSCFYSQISTARTNDIARWLLHVYVMPFPYNSQILYPCMFDGVLSGYVAPLGWGEEAGRGGEGKKGKVGKGEGQEGGGEGRVRWWEILSIASFLTHIQHEWPEIEVRVAC